MNQIIYIPNRLSQEQNKTKKEKTKLYIFFSLFSFITFLVLSFQIYAYHNVEQNNENILSAKSITKVNAIEEENTEDEILPIINEEKSQKAIDYTASNGEKYETIGILNIPTLNIEYPILASTSTELLKISLTKYHGANPNEVGNMVIVGHNYHNGEFFSDLHKIKKGDIIKITDLQGITLDYEVYDFKVIDPYDNSGTSQLTNGQTEITLITCYNNGTERFMVKARAK